MLIFHFFTLDIVDKYKKRLEGMEKDIKDILKQEEEEKQVLTLFRVVEYLIKVFTLKK